MSLNKKQEKKDQSHTTKTPTRTGKKYVIISKDNTKHTDTKQKDKLSFRGLYNYKTELAKKNIKKGNKANGKYEIVPGKNERDTVPLKKSKSLFVYPTQPKELEEEEIYDGINDLELEKEVPQYGEVEKKDEEEIIESLDNAIKNLVSNDLYLFYELKKMRVPKGKIRVFTMTNFQEYSSTKTDNYKDYDYANIDTLLKYLIKNKKEKVSIIVGEDTFFVKSIKNKEKENYVEKYESNSLIFNFPEEYNKRLIGLKILKPGRVLLFDQENYFGADKFRKYIKKDSVKIKKKEKVMEIETGSMKFSRLKKRDNPEESLKHEREKWFKSFIIGPQTAIYIKDIKMLISESNPLSKITYDSIINSSDYNKYDPFELDDEDDNKSKKITYEIIPYKQKISESINVNGDCIVLYKYSFGEKDNVINIKDIDDNDNEEYSEDKAMEDMGGPYSFCSDYFDNSISSESIKTHINHTKKKANNEICTYCLYDLNKKEFKSVFVGENVVAVAFSETNHQGIAFPINNELYNIETTYIEKMKSIFILKENCILLFNQPKFEGRHTQFCASIDSIPLATNAYFNKEFKYGSMIIGKNTLIETFSKEDYKGKKKFLYSEHVARFHHRVLSIRIHSTENKIALINQESLQAKDCIMFYVNTNYEGDSYLKCDNQRLESDIIFNSLKVSEEVRLFLNYEINKKSFIFFNKTSSKNLVVSKDLETITSSGKEKKNIFNFIIPIKKGCIVLFDKKMFKGKSFKICDNTPNLLSEEDCDLTEVYSIIVGPETEVQLYNNFNFLTNNKDVEPTTISKDIEDMSEEIYKPFILQLYSIKFADKSNSLKIYNGKNRIKNLMYGFLNGFFFKGDLKNKDNIKSEKELEQCLPETMNFEELDIEGIFNYGKNLESFSSGTKDSTESDSQTTRKTAKERFLGLKKIRHYFCNYRYKASEFLGRFGDAVASNFRATSTNLIKSEGETFLYDFKENLNNEKEVNKDFLVDSKEFEDLDNIKKKIYPIKDKDKTEDSKSAKLTKKSTLSIEKATLSTEKSTLSTEKKEKKISIGKKIGKFFVSVKNNIKNILKYIYDKIIKKIIKAIKKIFSKMIEWIKDFFTTKIKQFIKFIQCSYKLFQKFFEKISKITNLFFFITTAISTVGSGVGIIMLIDFALAQMCQYKEFKYALSFFSLANLEQYKDSNIKYTLIGQGIGTLVGSVVDSSPLLLNGIRLFGAVFNTTAVAISQVGRIGKIKA